MPVDGSQSLRCGSTNRRTIPAAGLICVGFDAQMLAEHIRSRFRKNA